MRRRGRQVELVAVPVADDENKPKAAVATAAKARPKSKYDLPERPPPPKVVTLHSFRALCGHAERTDPNVLATLSGDSESRRGPSQDTGRDTASVTDGGVTSRSMDSSVVGTATARRLSRDTVSSTAVPVAATASGVSGIPTATASAISGNAATAEGKKKADVALVTARSVASTAGVGDGAKLIVVPPIASGIGTAADAAAADAAGGIDVSTQRSTSSVVSIVVGSPKAPSPKRGGGRKGDATARSTAAASTVGAASTAASLSSPKALPLPSGKSAAAAADRDAALAAAAASAAETFTVYKRFGLERPRDLPIGDRSADAIFTYQVVAVPVIEKVKRERGRRGGGGGAAAGAAAGGGDAAGLASPTAASVLTSPNAAAAGAGAGATTAAGAGAGAAATGGGSPAPPPAPATKFRDDVIGIQSSFFLPTVPVMPDQPLRGVSLLPWVRAFYVAFCVSDPCATRQCKLQRCGAPVIVLLTRTVDRV